MDEVAIAIGKVAFAIWIHAIIYGVVNMEIK